MDLAVLEEEILALMKWYHSHKKIFWIIGAPAFVFIFLLSWVIPAFGALYFERVNETSYLTENVISLIVDTEQQAEKYFYIPPVKSGLYTYRVDEYKTPTGLKGYQVMVFKENILVESFGEGPEAMGRSFQLKETDFSL